MRFVGICLYSTWCCPFCNAYIIKKTLTFHTGCCSSITTELVFFSPFSLLPSPSPSPFSSGLSPSLSSSSSYIYIPLPLLITLSPSPPPPLPPNSCFGPVPDPPAGFRRRQCHCTLPFLHLLVLLPASPGSHHLRQLSREIRVSCMYNCICQPSE